MLISAALGGSSGTNGVGFPAHPQHEVRHSFPTDLQTLAPSLLEREHPGGPRLYIAAGGTLS